MKNYLALIIIFFCGKSFALTMNFDELSKGSSLQGWTQGFYGTTGSPRWQIEEDPNAPSPRMVLKQTGKAVYSWLVKSEPQIQDGFVEADLKVISGREDPEVGLVWRHQDGKNYYYVRINALEDNVIFYRMRDGKKESIKEAEAKVGFGGWHHLKIQFQGEQVEVIFDQKPVLSVRDSSFKGGGRVGFFTTADTIGAFDNFTAEPRKK